MDRIFFNTLLRSVSGPQCPDHTLTHKCDCTSRAPLDTFRVAAAQVALEGLAGLGIHPDGAEGAGFDTLVAIDAVFRYDRDDALFVVPHNRAYGAGLQTGRFGAVPADHRRIVTLGIAMDPYPRLGRIELAGLLEGASHLTDSAVDA